MKSNNKPNVIRNLFLFFLLFTATNVFYAQNPFDKFDSSDEITSIVVTKKMFEIMSKVKVDPSDKEMQQYNALLKKLDNLKVFTTKNSKAEEEMKQTAERYVRETGLDELMRANNSGKNIKTYVKTHPETTKIKELLLFIDGNNTEETVLLSLFGNFELNELAILIDKMKIPGGSQAFQEFVK